MFSCSLLALVSCTADNLVDPNLEGTASFTVLDANTNQPVDGVKLEFVGGADKKTSSSGQTTFEKVRAGAYLVRLSKKGYETSQEPLTIGTSGTENVVAINVAQTYRIHRIGPSIKGRVLMRPMNNSDTTATVSADSVTVELRLTAAGTGSGSTLYLAPVRTVKTSATGWFTFDSIPEVSNYSLVVPEFSRSGKVYSQSATTVASGTLVGSQQFAQPNVVLSPAASGTLQVFARSLNLVANQGWVFEFSSSIDTARSGSASILLRTLNLAINSQRVWSENFTVLTIRPSVGTWTAASTYSVNFSGVRDVQNRVITNTTITANTTP